MFGYFLHHFPYFGLRGADDAAQLAQAAYCFASGTMYRKQPDAVTRPTLALAA